MHMVGFILVAGGLLAIWAAAEDWDFVFDSHKFRPLVAVFGRSGARVIYALGAAVIMTIGLLIVLQVIPLEFLLHLRYGHRR